MLVADKVEARSGRPCPHFTGRRGKGGRTCRRPQRIWMPASEVAAAWRNCLTYQLRLFRPDAVQLVGGSGPEDLDFGALRAGGYRYRDRLCALFDGKRVIRARGASLRRGADRDCRQGQRTDAEGAITCCCSRRPPRLDSFRA